MAEEESQNYQKRIQDNKVDPNIPVNPPINYNTPQTYNTQQGYSKNSIYNNRGPSTTQNSGSQQGIINKKEEHLKKLDEMQKKKEKIENMRSLLNLKRKIYALINIGKPEEAKQTYDTLYLLYQSMLKNHSQDELVIIKNAVAEVYTALEQALNKKKVKKGHFTEVEKRKDEKSRRTKVVTTDLDIIIQLVEEKGKLSLSDIQARFNVPKRLAEEWIQILADYGLVEIKYLPIGGVEITKIK